MDKLIVAIINTTNTKKIKEGLLSSGFRLTELKSTGGLLGRENSTLLIGAQSKDVDSVLDVIKKNCSKREEFVADSGAEAMVGLEDMPLPESATKLSLGGATVFVIDVERFEKI